ncbi:MAG: cytochrome d ubiquinol oxidase subunit II [Bacteroidetes bacterium]|nr:cytochrome d ubiquinol oxidase subunit II [Bacteroidota bacterium]
MNGTDTYLLLQQYWWVIVSLLGSILVFLMFVQGGQTLIYTLGKTTNEQKMLVNSLGRKWELTFTTLVTFGGAFFASFPLFYSTSFGGAYWVWIAILLAFVVQAVAYEYRTKPNNFFGSKTYEAFLLINGILGTILIGTAVATFFTGSEFSVDKIRLTNPGSPVISRWEGPAHGLEAALNPQNLILGLTIFFLARTLAILYFMNNIKDDQILSRSRKHLWYNAMPFVVLFLTFVIWLMLSKGFAVDPVTNQVFLEDYKYFHNLLSMPVVLILFLAGVVLVLTGLYLSLLRSNKHGRKGIWLTGPGTILAVLSLLLLAGFNHTAYYPSTYDLQSSLTITNSSSSIYTLRTMFIVSLIVPFVAAYIWYAWRAMDKKPITGAEMENDHHAY